MVNRGRRSRPVPRVPNTRPRPQLAAPHEGRITAARRPPERPPELAEDRPELSRDRPELPENRAELPENRAELPENRSELLETLGEPFVHEVRDEAGHIAAVLHDFLHEAGGEVGVQRV